MDKALKTIHSPWKKSNLGYLLNGWSSVLKSLQMNSAKIFDRFQSKLSDEAHETLSMNWYIFVVEMIRS
jgi:hypothetical protein